MVKVLGIEVSHTQLLQWHAWLMPVRQPFLVPKRVARVLRYAEETELLSAELRDSFGLYSTGRHAVCWLTRWQSGRLPIEVRRGQPGPHRWPSQDRAADLGRVVRFVESGRRPSRHDQVSNAEWAAVAPVLPNAWALAGRFPSGSGQNCFGTVMGAAGVPDAAGTWMQRAPFEAWLAEHTQPVRGNRRDDEPGVVLVWRSRDGLVQHAAVTMGAGRALHKPSQGWMSPTKVLTIPELRASVRVTGNRLERWVLVR